MRRLRIFLLFDTLTSCSFHPLYFMFRKLFLSLSLFVFGGILLLHPYLHPIVHAHEHRMIFVEVLGRADCKHCVDQKRFFDDLSTTRDDLQITYYDISNPAHKELWSALAELEGIPKVTPVTLIGDTVIQGFDTAETTGQLLVDLIDHSSVSMTIAEFIASGGSGNVHQVTDGGCDEESETCSIEYKPYYVSVPFFDTIDIKRYSLPTLSVILGFIDGFNPCAMWVLVTFLLILIQIGDKKKMWRIAGLFIVAEAVMYYLILNVWFHVWDFVGLDNIVTPIVGAVAIFGGLFFLWEWKTSDGTCKVTNLEQRSKTRTKIQRLVAAEMTLLTVLGIIGLALSVNIIEFACSIGIPQAFTKILDINHLGVLTKHFYMGLYIFFYMIDDLIVFGIALYSFEKLGITTKYAKLCNFIGGALMIVLGALLLLRPSMLIF